MIYLDGSAYDGKPMSGDVCALRQLLSDVPRTEAPALTPVRVPVRPVGASGAAALPALNRFQPVGDFRLLGRAFRVEAWAVAVKQQPSDEDHQAPKVVLVEPSDRPDELTFDRH
jgi:hypothetical protein